ncbi:MAG: histidine kinase, partial [Bacteroidota bacterium]
QKDIENRVIELYSLLSKIAFIREDFEKSTYYKGIYEKKMAENVRHHKDNNMVQFIADYYTKIDQDREQAKIRSYSMTLLGSLLFLLAFTFSANRYQRYRTKKRLEKETIDKRMAELRALKAQINPHFLFNALNSIQEYLFSNEKNVAEGYLVKYGKLMRKTLDHSNELTVSLQEELETLRLYVDLEQLRVKHGFDFEVKIAEELDPHLVQIPSMVIQPFIENAIWHGVSKLKYKGIISLSFDLDDDLLVVRIRDNGKGFDVKTVANGTISKGVNLVRKRLELLRTPVGDETVLEIRSAVGKGTEVTLRFSGELV